MTINPDIKKEFEEIYVNHYSRMKFFAQEYVIREEDAENIVQDVFAELWINRELIPSHSNIFSFLFTSVKNKSIDLLRRNTVSEKARNIIQAEHLLLLEMKLHSLEHFDDSFSERTDVESLIKNAIDSLPERCRQIFVLNKIEGIKQKQIAENLNISIHTVESQMSIASKRLRALLKELLPLLIFMLN